MKRIACFCLALLLILVSLPACSDKTEFSMADVSKEIDSKSVSDFTVTDEVTEYVMITVQDHGSLVVRLRPDVAPITVENFQDLVGRGFYNGLTFHRVYAGFMIQGGDPSGNGTGGSGKTIKGEFSKNGVDNPLSHVRGVISMARLGSNMDSATSQFFIMHADATKPLDGLYGAFGYVVAGLSVVDSIASVFVTYNAKGEKSVPVEPVVITSAQFVKLAK